MHMGTNIQVQNEEDANKPDTHRKQNVMHMGTNIQVQNEEDANKPDTHRKQNFGCSLRKYNSSSVYRFYVCKFCNPSLSRPS